jgi:hypothetical protein
MPQRHFTNFDGSERERVGYPRIAALFFLATLPSKGRGWGSLLFSYSSLKGKGLLPHFWLPFPRGKGLGVRLLACPSLRVLEFCCWGELNYWLWLLSYRSLTFCIRRGVLVVEIDLRFMMGGGFVLDASRGSSGCRSIDARFVAGLSNPSLAVRSGVLGASRSGRIIGLRARSRVIELPPKTSRGVCLH